MIDNNMDIEFESPERIKTFQDGLLHKALAYLNSNSAYYRRMFERYEIDITKIQTLEDLVKIPFTEKKDLQILTRIFSVCQRRRL